MPLLALACAGCLLAPWFTSGAVTRSGYGFLRALEGSGLASGFDAHLLTAAAFALPVLAGLSAAGAVLGWRRVSVGAAAIGGGTLVALSAYVLGRQGGTVPAGPWAGALVGCVTLGGAVARWRARHRAGRQRPVGPDVRPVGPDVEVLRP